jgi:hypothetical protein
VAFEKRRNPLRLDAQRAKPKVDATSGGKMANPLPALLCMKETPILQAP